MFSISNNQLKILIAIAASLTCMPAAFSQATDIRNPLIMGTPSEAPGMAPSPQQAPAMGSLSGPFPVSPGMEGQQPSLLPSVQTLPANDINLTNSNVGLPFSPSMTSQPGTLGPSLTPFIPAPPSTPGMNPGSLQSPNGFFNPAQQSLVNPGGGLPGTGGFNSTIPNMRRSGQTTQQYEYRGRQSVFGQGSGAAGGLQDEVTRLGPTSGYGMPYGVPTGTAGNARNSSIDLGGGARVKNGGTTVSNGSTVGDYGLSVMRNGFNSAGISAQQALDFGQGRRNNGTFSNNTTDFGLPYTQFNQVNETPQKTGQFLQPSAVITNF